VQRDYLKSEQFAPEFQQILRKDSINDALEQAAKTDATKRS
jgi:hypothetical protein